MGRQASSEWDWQRAIERGKRRVQRQLGGGGGGGGADDHRMCRQVYYALPNEGEHGPGG